MKKIGLLLLALTSITAILCACGNTSTIIDSENPKESKKSSQTTVSESTSTESKIKTSTTIPKAVNKTETSSKVSETEDNSETNAEIAETESDSEVVAEIPEIENNEENSPETVTKCQLNVDLLSNIGLTYDEIINKYGDLKDVSKLPNGDFCYSFTQGCMGYLWNFDEVSKVENILLPNAGVKCRGILIFEAKDFFLGLENSVSPSELGEMYGITYKSSGYNSHDDCNYSAFNLDDKYIYVETKESEVIAPNSSIQISLILE